VRDRASYASALVSVAVDLTMEEGRIARCALAFGSLGTVPWRDPAVEEVLIGQEPSPRCLLARPTCCCTAPRAALAPTISRSPCRALAATLAQATKG
jgi:xanthine dehydrogenase YagS FAD-binding subunit